MTATPSSAMTYSLPSAARSPSLLVAVNSSALMAREAMPMSAVPAARDWKAVAVPWACSSTRRLAPSGRRPVRTLSSALAPGWRSTLV